MWNDTIINASLTFSTAGSKDFTRKWKRHQKEVQRLDSTLNRDIMDPTVQIVTRVSSDSPLDHKIPTWKKDASDVRIIICMGRRNRATVCRILSFDHQLSFTHRSSVKDKRDTRDRNHEKPTQEEGSWPFSTDWVGIPSLWLHVFAPTGKWTNDK